MSESGDRCRKKKNSNSNRSKWKENNDSDRSKKKEHSERNKSRSKVNSDSDRSRKKKNCESRSKENYDRDKCRKKKNSKSNGSVWKGKKRNSESNNSRWKEKDKERRLLSSIKEWKSIKKLFMDHLLHQGRGRGPRFLGISTNPQPVFLPASKKNTPNLLERHRNFHHLFLRTICGNGTTTINST
jgi:hypothetical protein